MDNPEIYINWNSMQKKCAIELLKERKGLLQWAPGEQVLDVGCGPGDVTATVLFPLLPEDATLVGCDISEEMITYCNQYIKNERLSFKIQDIEHKDIATGNLQLETFNKIFSFYCFHWIKDHRQALQNIYSLLKPGGEILHMFITSDDPILLVMNKLKVSNKWSKFIKDIQWFNRTYTPLYFHDILQDIGFHNINCYIQDKTNNYPSLENLAGSLMAFNPYLKYIPEELKSQYIQDLIDTLKEEGFIKYDKVNGNVIYEYNLMIVIAQKPK